MDNLDDAVQRLLSHGVTKMIFLPLYPQFSSSTVATIWDGLAVEHPTYIAALKGWAEHSFAQHGEPDLLLLSYHGIQQRFVNEGEDYPQRCKDTTDALSIAPLLALRHIKLCLLSNLMLVESPG